MVLPLYTAALAPDEWAAIEQCCTVLERYPITIALDLALITQRYPKLLIERFEDAYFRSVADYNRLMLSVEFYARFYSRYQFVLTHQTDVWVFRDARPIGAQATITPARRGRRPAAGTSRAPGACSSCSSACITGRRTASPTSCCCTGWETAACRCAALRCFWQFARITDPASMPISPAAAPSSTRTCFSVTR